MKIGKYFIYLGQKINTINWKLVFPAMVFLESDTDIYPESYTKIFWRLYKKSWT